MRFALVICTKEFQSLEHSPSMESFSEPPAEKERFKLDCNMICSPTRIHTFLLIQGVLSEALFVQSFESSHSNVEFLDKLLQTLAVHKPSTRMDIVNQNMQFLAMKMPRYTFDLLNSNTEKRFGIIRQVG